jgi:hypothetical protein
MEETNEDKNEYTTTIVVDQETTQINNEDVAVGACIKLCSQHSMRHWNWRVNLESRQLIQSLLVVMSVIPNALFEAICIQKCNLPGIDGKVPLEIIEELVCKLLQVTARDGGARSALTIAHADPHLFLHTR